MNFKASWIWRGLFAWLLTTPKVELPSPHAGNAEPGVIREVEELRAELQVEPAVGAKPVVLEQAEIQVVGAIPADVRQRPRGGAVSERRRLAEHARC